MRRSGRIKASFSVTLTGFLLYGLGLLTHALLLTDKYCVGYVVGSLCQIWFPFDWSVEDRA